MVRPSITAALLLLAASARAAEPAPNAGLDAAALADAATEARFTEYVARGDRARAAGDRSEAVLSYSEALRLRSDPLISGRLGVLLVELGRPTQAAGLLHEAITRDYDASPEERLRIEGAFRAARKEVCWLDVKISHPPEQTTLDGKATNKTGRNEFFLFVTPGQHELRAILRGYQDGVAVFTACKGRAMDVPIVLTPLPTAPAIEAIPEEEPALKPAVFNPGISKRMTVIDGSPISKQEDPFAYDDPPSGKPSGSKKSGVRGSIGAGPAMVLGVASWTPAVGPSVFGSLRPNEVLSLDLDLRAAWLVGGVGGSAIDAMTAGGLFSLCAHWKWVFGCASGHLGLIKVESTQDPYRAASYAYFLPGLGARMGIDVPISGSFAVRVAADVLGLSRGTTVIVEQRILSDVPAVMAGVTLAGVWLF